MSPSCLLFMILGWLLINQELVFHKTLTSSHEVVTTSFVNCCSLLPLSWCCSSPSPCLRYQQNWSLLLHSCWPSIRLEGPGPSFGCLVYWSYSKICPIHCLHARCSVLASRIAVHLLQDSSVCLVISLVVLYRSASQSDSPRTLSCRSAKSRSGSHCLRIMKWLLDF